MPFIVELQAGWKDGYVMQRFGMDFPLLNYDYDVSLVVPIGESGLSPYFGVGVDTINLLAFAIAFDAHAGLEIQLEEVAIFTEYEATSLLDGKSFQSLSVGLKFYQ